MKTLRILTGVHVGANIHLCAGKYRITRFCTKENIDVQDGDAPITPFEEIQLVDWPDATLVLTISDVGVATFEVLQETDEQLIPTLWVDFDIRQWGPVTFCLANSDEEWPSDTDLLKRRKGQHRPNVSSGENADVKVNCRFWAARAGMLGVGLLITLGALSGRTGSAASEPSYASPGSAIASLERTLAKDGFLELHINGVDKQINVSGLVAHASDGRKVRSAVEIIQSKFGLPINQSWQVADDISATMETALRTSSIHARYIGGGRFEIYGNAKEPKLISNAVDQLKNDLGSNVREIEVAVEPIVLPDPFSVAMASEGLRYSQRPDGAKLFNFKN